MSGQHVEQRLLRSAQSLTGLHGSGLAFLLRRWPQAAAATFHTARSSSSSSTSESPAADATAGNQASASSSATQPASLSPSLPPGVFQQSCKVAGKQWTFETGRLAKLAHGSCLVTVGGTSVLSTAVVDPTPQTEADGVPLQVEYRERLSAAGRLPSRPDRRERVGGERELLAGRLVDRALRPLLPPGFLYDTQVWCQVLSADGCVDPEVVAINAASAALLLARDIPFTHPVGAVKAGFKRTRFLLNPSVSVLSEPAISLSLTYAGSPYKATAIEATARQVSNAVFIRAMRWAAHSTHPLIQTQLALAAAAQGASSSSSSSSSSSPVAGLAAAVVQQQAASQHLFQLPMLWPSQQLQATVQQLMEKPLQGLFSQHQQQQQQQQKSPAAAADNPAAAVNKESRAAGLTGLKHQLLADLRRLGMLADDQTQLPAGSAATAAAAAAAAGLVRQEDALRAFDVLQSRVMRQLLLQGGARVDGRGVCDLRPISCQAGPLPRVVHGSGLFSRGETQCLATATVGHDRDMGQVESLFSRCDSSRTPLHLHYTFPPFSVGELGKAGPPNRREIGHGNLARAALLGLMPAEDEFPFSVRVTADTLSSSGSSSMAAVCAGALALRAAGVPMQGLAAGISVGLVTQSPPQLMGPAAGGISHAAGGGIGHGISHDGSQQQQQQQQQQEEGAEGEDSSSSSGVASYSSYVMHQGLAKQQPAAADGEAADGSSSSSSDEDDSSSSSSSDEDDSSSSSSSSGIVCSSYGPALLLTDIQGFEDHHGDMDFKVAGTSRGITAVQLDTKLPGVDLSLLAAALEPAAAARAAILSSMSAAGSEYEGSLEPVELPQHGSLEIMKELVPRLIGPQGSTLLEIEEQCGAAFIVDDTGAVTIYAPTQHQYQHAVAAVQEVEGRGVQAGQVYRVRVLRVVDFGAYVALPNGLPALLHVSELSHAKIREVREVVKEGEEFDVLCKGRDAKGFVRLSRKDLLPNPDGGGVQGGGLAGKGGSGSGSGTGSWSAGGVGGAGGGSDANRGSSRKSRREEGAGPPRAWTWQPSAEDKERQRRQQQQQQVGQQQQQVGQQQQQVGQQQQQVGQQQQQQTPEVKDG